MVKNTQSSPPAGRARTGRWVLAGWCALGVGALLAAFPPLSWWPLAFVALVPLIVMCSLTPRAGRWMFAAAAAFFTLGNLWVTETNPVSLVPIVVVESVWLAALGIAWRGVLRAGFSPMPAVPLLWTAVEFGRSWLPYGGYPWNQLGMPLAASPVMVQAADLSGVFGLGFVAASGATLVLCLGWRSGWLPRPESVPRPSRLSVGAAGAVVLAAVAYGLVRPSTLVEPTPGPLVGTIQPGFPQELKDDGMPPDQRLAVCLDLTRECLARYPDLDLLLWPETMWPWPAGEGAATDVWFEGEDERGRWSYGPPDANRQIATGLALMGIGKGGPQLLLGTSYYIGDARRGEVRHMNSALLYARDGQLAGRYHKHLLVPGGEFVPLVDVVPASWLEWIGQNLYGLPGFLAHLTPGPGPVTLPLDDGTSMGVTICYENAYAGYFRRVAAMGAAFFVNLSNEAWFGDSTEFDHMELHAILRAVETRRALFRSTNSGISCLVRPDGTRPERLEVAGQDREVSGIFARRIPLHTDFSLYVRCGDLAGWIAVALAGMLCTWAGLRGRQTPGTRAGVRVP